MNSSSVNSAIRAVLFLLVIGALLPFYLLAFPFGARPRRLFSLPFYRASVALTGLSVTANLEGLGRPGTLFVANHVSYLDIPVLASLFDASFVAKADVKGWPLFGFLASIGRTIFVSRRASRMVRERLEIANRLAAGESVVLFPEGSSSDGSGVLPFRTGLLSAVQIDDELPVAVQPVTIVYGPELGQPERDCYAWYGDMDLVPHLWRLFGFSARISVQVRFHPPRMASTFEDRRQLARWAESRVATGLADALAVKGVPAAAPALEPSEAGAAALPR